MIFSLRPYAEGRLIHIHKGLLSSDQVVFVLYLRQSSVYWLMLELSVSGFIGTRDVNQETTIAFGLGIFCVFIQLIILNHVRNKVGNLTFS